MFYFVQGDGMCTSDSSATVCNHHSCSNRRVEAAGFVKKYMVCDVVEDICIT